MKIHEALPCTDPQAGDEVGTKTGRIRTVVRRDGGEVTYRTEKGTEKNCWISTWQDWCRKNAVSTVMVGRQNSVPSKGGSDE